MIDEPRSLKNPEVKSARHKMLGKDHIRPLTQFVEKIRNEKNLLYEIPYFDPLDGGVNARCLSVLQDPGRKTQETGFVSRNNPDATAENFYKAYKEANIPRNETVLWNLIPWYSNSEPEFWASFDEGLKYLKELISILPNLSVVILHGNKAKMAKKELENSYKSIHVIESWHTSPQPNAYPLKKDEIREHLQEVYKVLFQ